MNNRSRLLHATVRCIFGPQLRAEAKKQFGKTSEQTFDAKKNIQKRCTEIMRLMRRTRDTQHIEVLLLDDVQ